MRLIGGCDSDCCSPSDRFVSAGENRLSGLWMQRFKQGLCSPVISCALPDFALTLGCAGMR